MSDFIEAIVWSIVSILVVAVPVLIIGYLVDKISCEATARALSFTPHYSILTGCVVEKPNGKRVLLDQIRNIGVSKESE